MSKKIAIATVLFFGFLAGTNAHAQAFNVSLDGYCNTFALTINSWEIYGTRGGCNDNEIEGGAVASIGTPAKRYYSTNDSEDLQEVFSWYFTKPTKKGKGSWYLYRTDGTSESLINSGTYTTIPAGQEPRNTSDRNATAPKNR